MSDNATIQTPRQFAASLPAALAASGLNINALRTNGLLRTDEWKAMDQAVVRIARQRLNVVADLRNAGLVRNLGGLGVLVDQWETSSDMSAANIDLSGVTPGQEDAIDFHLHSVPIPVVHKDFRLNIRHLEASRRMGTPLDTFGVETATRKVRDALEDLVIVGSTAISVGGNSIPGYTTHPDRNTGDLTAAWTLPQDRDIIQDVLDMIADAEAANHFGPFNLYVSTTYYAELRGDYSADKGDKTYLERILAIPEISAVKPVDRMPAVDDVLLVQLTSDVVDLAVGQDIVPVEWATQGGMVEHYKVMAVMAPRIKSDDDGNSGIVHYDV